MKYFEKLFNALSEIDEETGERYIWLDSDTLDSPEELKKYMVNILTSNMQYDFHIDFDEENVKEFAEAICPKTDLWKLQYDQFEHNGVHTLKDFVNAGLNAVVYNGQTFWKYHGEYNSDDDFDEETLNTTVECDHIGTDDDGYAIIYVTKVEG